MKEQLNALDSERTIGRVTLTDGKTRLSVPKMSMLKIIRIVKFLGIDGAKLYEEFQETIADTNMEDLEKFAVILEGMKEEQLIRIMSILLELEDEETLNLDHDEMLDVMLIYADNYDFNKTFQKVRQLMKKMFKRDIPDLPELMDKWIPKKAEKEIQEPVGQSS